MAVVDALLIVNCVAEFSIFNIFLGHQPNWYILAFPYFLHPLKVSWTLYMIGSSAMSKRVVLNSNFMAVHEYYINRDSLSQDYIP